MRAATRLPMRSAVRHATVLAAARRAQPSAPSIAFSRHYAPHGNTPAWPGIRLTVRLMSSPAGQKPADEAKAATAETSEGKKPEEAAAAAAETPEEKPMPEAAEPSSGEDAAPAEGASEDAAEAPPTPKPIVLFKAKSLSKHFTQAESMVNYSSFCCACGLGAALLGIAPFTAPNTFCVALMLAVVQVRLAHTWQTRVLRLQVRRHVEEVVQEAEGLISIRSGGGLQRTLRLTSEDAVAAEKPPLSEVLRHGRSFVFIDRSQGTEEAKEALEELLASNHAIASEDIVVNAFEGEPQGEAEKVTQHLAKITAKELENIAKQSAGEATPKAAIGQVARSASTIAGVILVVGGIIGFSGRRQADNPPPDAVPLRQ